MVPQCCGRGREKRLAEGGSNSPCSEEDSRPWRGRRGHRGLQGLGPPSSAGNVEVLTKPIPLSMYLVVDVQIITTPLEVTSNI